MQMNQGKKVSSFILCMVLIVAMALVTTGCNGRPKTESGTQSDSAVQTQDNVQDGSDAQSDDTQLGEGSTEFAFTVVDQEGSETHFTIHTDKETVGEALLELGLIEGEDSEYGLFVKTVNGITADYDTDGVYWAFYVNDEYAQSGVDATAVTAGESYAFKVE